MIVTAEVIVVGALDVEVGCVFYHDNLFLKYVLTRKGWEDRLNTTFGGRILVLGKIIGLGS